MESTSLERRGNPSTSSRSSPQLPTLRVQTRASKSRIDFRCSRLYRLHRFAALMAVVALVVIFSLLFSTDNSSQSMRHRMNSERLSQTPLRLNRLEVNQSILNNLDIISVSFEYSPPHLEFYGANAIAAYCVSLADELSGRMPAAHEYMAVVRTDGKASGTIEIGPLVNMRCSWLLRFITDDFQVLKESELLRFKHGPTQPLQVHLALTQNTSEMRVKWVSDPVPNPVVMFGEHKDKLDRIAKATHSSYTSKDMCGEPATVEAPLNFRDPGQIFDAVMTNLKAGKKYYYQVGEQNGKVSDIFEFRMIPPKGNNKVGQESSVSFFVYGDLNMPVQPTSNFALDNGTSGTTMKLIRDDLELAAVESNSHKYFAVMHVGDLAYAYGATYIWDHFGHLIEYVAARLPYMITIGNHDYGYLEGVKKDPIKWPSHSTFEKDGTSGFNSGGECGVPAAARFHMPENGNGVYWYSFDSGLAHHVMLSSEHEFARGSTLHKWLVKDLSTIDRSKTPWVFVYIHRPLYCSVAYSHDYYRSLLFRDELEQELADHHVDVVFAGHYHSYERTCPVFGDRCIESPSGKAMAPVHITIGSAGFTVDTAGFYRSNWRKKGFLEHGYGRVHIYNWTHMHFEFVSNTERRVKDETWIVSTHDWSSKRERFPPGYFPTQEIAGLAAAVVLSLSACFAVFIPAIRQARNTKFISLRTIRFRN
ncbi:nucleotide pyrophosphatase phosphodiesterase [Plasmopara halstedii]|uniref:Purple acid phosphatase n=1 Tax=Plasmopara halstedii TaxID=4781 RepID=A0A0P1ACC3_PLAHL|nr:nucleotide pyrophosphatase phosphodiesterase [Plasmopara halstedii]CEG37960.1 nucleotide pyrophosphatase phosphodiesterase [Plasmopara halstedii]|eukprot:XP_024574329.1 nucleotide pyrophosphatase phosphodiesterase [Plasmopara halstedii]